MPRIGEKLLDTVFYLYPNRLTAESGIGAGGTGFLVAVKSKTVATSIYLYAVTNSHVIKAIPDHPTEHPHLRLNLRNGGWVSGDVPKDRWVHHPNLDDIAVFGLRLDKANDLALHWFFVENFATQEAVEKYQIGPGDSVCMIGRFINHEGKERNLPSVRFGNISRMPWEPIAHQWGFNQESYLVECRSLPGFSGSPVLVYDEQLHIGFTRKDRMMQALLLGIDWCHPPSWQYVQEKDQKQNAWIARKDLRVDTNSGMAGVIPAWKIKEILDGEPFRSERDANDKKLQERADRQAMAPALDSAGDVEADPVATEVEPEASTKECPSP